MNEVNRRGIKVAFFDLGQEVKKSHGPINKVKKAGHTIANHSWSHLQSNNRRTKDFCNDEILKEFLDTHKAIKDAAGIDVKHWRAPRLEQIKRLEGLVMNNSHLKYLEHNDIHVDSKDAIGASDKETLLRNIRNGLKKRQGKNLNRILFHVKESTANNLKWILEQLEKDGHTIVDFSQGPITEITPLPDDPCKKKSAPRNPAPAKSDFVGV